MNIVLEPALADRASRQAAAVAAPGPLRPPHALLRHGEDTVPCECDGPTACRQTPLAVALPETEAQVAAVLRACHDAPGATLQRRDPLAGDGPLAGAEGALDGQHLPAHVAGGPLLGRPGAILRPRRARARPVPRPRTAAPLPPPKVPD